MKTPIKAPECDWMCPYRECYHPGENKGTYTVGRGYTYHKKPIPACMTCLKYGCPDKKVVRPDWHHVINDVEAMLTAIHMSHAKRDILYQFILNLITEIKDNDKDRKERCPECGN